MLKLDNKELKLGADRIKIAIPAIDPTITAKHPLNKDPTVAPNPLKPKNPKINLVNIATAERITSKMRQIRQINHLADQ